MGNTNPLSLRTEDSLKAERQINSVTFRNIARDRFSAFGGPYHAVSVLRALSSQAVAKEKRQIPLALSIREMKLR